MSEVETLTPAQMILAKLDAVVGDIAALRAELAEVKDIADDTADAVDEIGVAMDLLTGADDDDGTE